VSREKQVKSKDIKTEELNFHLHSIESEQAVLGWFILDNTSWDKVSGLIFE
jgi:hypothetical protein